MPFGLCHNLFLNSKCNVVVINMVNKNNNNNNKFYYTLAFLPKSFVFTINIINRVKLNF